MYLSGPSSHRCSAEGAEIPPVVIKCVESYRVAYTKYPDLEPEVPMLIVALAAAAVHFCLSEWATGSLHMVEFRGDKARPEYCNNMELLQKIQ
ncbi:hypothetical protein BT96DRAFT_990682 [Gymnopus androsaceus JB14]|uniref:DUF6532 domain-containing protein n=1 Tax=Gymnopus androsaceus JB14 TaxID=1447944 RepID=A0A6A4HX02_9AGAR|nr:hypothetical protein BT96DRAFT_990682 [Gymnopus androsaceus JB14]